MSSEITVVKQTYYNGGNQKSTGLIDIADWMAETLVTASMQNTPAEFLSVIADSWSVALVSEMAPVLMPERNIAQQTRAEMLVARVPFAPLFTVIALCVLYVLLGIGATVLALANNDTTTRDVAVRLGVAGIVAGWFNTPRYTTPGVEISEMFYGADEKTKQHFRVGITRTVHGGWVFSS